MRIFIGIQMNDDTTERLENFIKPFQKISSPIRWIKRENYHLSLRFIGEVSENLWIRISDSISPSVFSIPSFPVLIRGCGSFGRGDHINIFWGGVQRSLPLQNLYDTLENQLEAIGIQKEARPFHPHITLGRNKKNHHFKSFFKKMEMCRDTVISEQTVDKFQIYQSTLLPDGPVYKILKEIPIGTT